MAANSLESSELQVKIFRLRKRLAELGEEVQDIAPSRAGKDGAPRDRGKLEAFHMARQADALERQVEAAEDPRRLRRAADAEKRFPGEGNVHFLVRRALKRCATTEQVDVEFLKLEKCTGSFGDSSGRIFTQEDLRVAQEKCSRELVRRAMEESDSEAADDDVPDVGRGRGRGGRGRGRRRPQGKKGANQGAQGGQPAADDADEEDEEGDLDGEQAIDLDEVLDEKALRGLMDMFESRQPPAAEDAWGEAWRASLPAGAWAEATLRGRLQQRGMEMPDGSGQSYPAPGHRGFNKYAVARMKLAGVGNELMQPSRSASSRSACPPLQPHQQSVAFLLHPCSPISRMLVDHPTGCGKTREMIQVLDQYFKDPRPKVAIFPTEAVCRNFYAEMLRWPSRYRDFFCCEEPEAARRAAGLSEGDSWSEHRQAFWSLAPLREAELRSLCARVRECLEMQGTFVMGKLRKSRLQRFRQAHPGELFPWAPLRALGYTSAGGSNIKLDPETGRPLSSLFKVGFGDPNSNVYDRKIVLMDEVHNLSRAKTRFGAQLQVLREKLASAEDCVIVGFTATPVPDNPSEGRVLLDTFKGDANVGRSDEGFVSSFPFKPWRLFPRSVPHGCATGATLDPDLQKQLCHEVELTGDALLHYDLKARDPEITGRRLQAYCNMFCWGGAFHDGQNGCKAEVMERPEILAPKLLAIARSVAEAHPRKRTKALVLVSRRTGYAAMVALMREVGRAAAPPFEVATMEQLAEFNSPDNLRGERFLVLVADTAECGEGISFRAVRRQFLADVPASPIALVQQCGRANRMYGHRGLRPEEQTLAIQLFTAVPPAWMRGDALAAWCFRVHGRKGAPGVGAEQRARRLLERLRSAGVKCLKDLKSKLDSFGAKKKALAKAPAAAKPPRGGRGAARGGAASGAGGDGSAFANGGGALTAAGKPEEPSLADEHAIDFLEKVGLADEARALRTSPKEAAAEGGGAPAREADLRQPARLLLRSVQALYSLDSARALRLATAASRTEDQRAVDRLRRLTDEFAPVLAAFRGCAVDRAVLAHLEETGGASARRRSSAAHCAAVARRRLTGKQRPAGGPATSRRLSAAAALGPTARRFSQARAATTPSGGKRARRTGKQPERTGPARASSAHGGDAASTGANGKATAAAATRAKDSSQAGSAPGAAASSARRGGAARGTQAQAQAQQRGAAPKAAGKQAGSGAAAKRSAGDQCDVATPLRKRARR